MRYTKEQKQETINFLAEKYDNNFEWDRPQIHGYLMNLVSAGSITFVEAERMFDLIVG